MPAIINGPDSHSPEKALKFLFCDIQYLRGIGPVRATALKNAGINSVFDLFFYAPRKYLDRSEITPIGNLQEGMVSTVIGEVTSFGEIFRNRRRFVVYIQDDSGILELVWFSGYKYLLKMFEEGDLIAATGRVGRFKYLQMSHPEFEIVSGKEDDPLHTRRLIPVYPETAALKQFRLHSRGLRKIIKPALDHLAGLKCETLPENLRRRYELLSLTDAIYQTHFPDSREKAEMALHRMSFEEFFYFELLLAARRHKRSTQEPGMPIPPPKRLGRMLLDNLKFELTRAQKKALNEIYRDMASPHPMNRLLQGDVGSGKTVVALLAMLAAVEAGYQAALMVPTEILAEQHGYAMSLMLKGMPVRLAVFTGSVRGKKRTELRQQIKEGEIDIVIGTQALIQEKLQFASLGMAVIDEQHRFGVAQRAALKSKGKYPDILIMTATPIPRTMAMTLYGDLDVSIIDEMPPGRMPVKTSFVPAEKRERMYQFIREQIESGRQAYIVFPLVEESEKIDLAAATEGYEKLSRDIFPEFRLALIHGRMKGREKNDVMEKFRAGYYHIIVGTTVIEVGLDVANATIMVIEQAERFGLSQIHQLRGRVGRGPYKSYCFLLSDKPLSAEAEGRIKAVCATNDGFRIAEADLQIRGPGELMGTKQHGLPELRVAKLTDSATLGLARECAFEIVGDDPLLMKPENRLLREVLIKKFSQKIKYSKTA